jgi:type II secretory pathway component PulJ
MKRRAYTLIEMIAVVTVGSALMGVSIVMLVALLKSEGSSRRHLEYCTILNRMDEQFRADVHAAATAKVSELGDEMELALPPPGKTLIRYRCQPNEITREELDEEKTLRRESYVLPEGVVYSLGQTSEGPLTMVMLHVDGKPVPGSKIHYPSTTMEAVLGKDRRFENEKQK